MLKEIQGKLSGIGRWLLRHFMYHQVETEADQRLCKDCYCRCKCDEYLSMHELRLPSDLSPVRLPQLHLPSLKWINHNMCACQAENERRFEGTIASNMRRTFVLLDSEERGKSIFMLREHIYIRYPCTHLSPWRCTLSPCQPPHLFC